MEAHLRAPLMIMFDYHRKRIESN